MKLSKALWISVQVAIGATIVVVASILVADYFDIYQTVKPYVVMSGSMEPAVKLGSVAIVRPQLSYSSGDVITYAQDGNQDQPITHRVVFRQFPQGLGSEPVYLTAGDANEDFDRAPVKTEHVVGKVMFSVPYLGYAVNLAKQPYGFILLVIVPATIVIYEELKTAIRELLKIIKRLVTKVRSRNREKVKSDSPKIEFIKRQNRSLPKITFLLPIIGSIFVFASLSGSFFQDMEDSIGNIFEAAETYAEPEESTPTPTPGEPTPTPTPIPTVEKLVINEVYYDVDSAGLRSIGGNDEDEPENEWIEIYNPNAFAVNFKDWEICDNNDCVTINPNVSVPALGFALVSRDASTFTFWTIPSGVEKIHSLGGTPLALSNSGDRLILSNPDGVEVDRMSWDSDITGFSSGCAATCPGVADGHSLEREPDGLDTDDAGDFTDRTTPTPGS